MTPHDDVERAFLGDPLQDRLLDAVLALTAELWVERDRRRILEQVLEARGLLSADLIEQHRDTEAQRAERAAARDALVRRVLGGLQQLPAQPRENSAAAAGAAAATPQPAKTRPARGDR